jgi:hypothetical protein
MKIGLVNFFNIVYFLGLLVVGVCSALVVNPFILPKGIIFKAFQLFIELAPEVIGIGELTIKNAMENFYCHKDKYIFFSFVKGY